MIYQAKMEIRSFLFMVKMSSKLIIVTALIISGCSTRSVKQTAPVKTPIVIKEMDIQKPGDAKSEEPQNPTVPTQSNTQQFPQAVLLPKFGIILSGGGAKSWAHIGVLKELQKLKWPISAVAGFEWGAVAAAIYAQNLSANEVEWEMSKLKEFEKWDVFLKAAFAKKMTADLKVPFVCPSLNIAKQSIFLLNRGQLDQLLPFCIASPSLIKPINKSVALMTDVAALAQHLRATGATKILLVNVMAQGTKRSFIKDFESSDNILWVESAAAMSKKPNGVDEVIDLKLDDYGIRDLDKRREIIAKGSELSYNQLKKLAEKFGL